MKAQVVKLTAYKDEDVMIIAPKEILTNFAWYLKGICFDAIDGATEKTCYRIAENYRNFVEQINKVLEEMEDTENDE